MEDLKELHEELLEHEYFHPSVLIIDRSKEKHEYSDEDSGISSTDNTPEIVSTPCSSFHKMIDFRLLSKIREEGLAKVHYSRRLGNSCSKQPWNPSNLTFGKCTAFVRFMVNRPINISSYGFYGPFEKGSKGKYHMEIALLTEDHCEIASNTQVTPIIKKSEVFHVKFADAVPILPCIWYFARFSLSGPPTCQSLKVLQHSLVKCDDFGDVKFTFEIPDSNQLPEIGFTLRA